MLDEIGQVDGRIVGEIAYMLANGQGKGRAARDGGDRARLSWRLLFLSTGETTLARHMGETGKKAKAGQELRLVSIEADAGAGMGLFENVHGAASPGAFADALVSACAANHGHAGPAFVERLVGETDAARATIEQGPRAVRPRDRAIRGERTGAAGRPTARLDRRGRRARDRLRADRLGACGPGSARRWSASPPGARRGRRRARTRQRRRSSRSAPSCSVTVRASRASETTAATTIRDLAGYVLDDGERYAIFPKVFRDEVAAGMRPETVTRALLARGLLVPDGAGKHQNKCRAGGKQQRMYVVRAAILEDDADCGLSR